jgi:DNA topoisomerase-2
MQSVEGTYKKVTQLEHVLLRPDTYVGSTQSEKKTMWVLEDDGTRIVEREISYVPALYKIFDEILVNAADNYQRDRRMTKIEVTIDSKENSISVWNNGKGNICLNVRNSCSNASFLSSLCPRTDIWALNDLQQL